MPREKIYKVGGADPRSGAERLYGLVNKGLSGIKGQNRQYDDDPTTMAKNKKKAAATKKKRGYK